MGRNVRGHFLNNVSGWRHAAIGAWSAADDPTIYGTLDVDVSRAIAYLDDLSRSTGRRLTMTHLVTKAVATALRQHAECNAYVRFGRIYQRTEVDIFVLVAVPSDTAKPCPPRTTDLSGAMVRNADQKDVVAICEEVESAAHAVRATGRESLRGLKQVIRALPPLLSRIGLRLVSFLQYDLNIDLTRVGVPRDSFGCAMVSSMGMLGIQLGFSPLVPMSRLSLMAGVGQVQDRAVVVDGQIVVRPILPLTATLDHRVVDGYQAGLLAQTVKQILEDPGAHLG